jgi:hypothetical protein
MIMVGLLALPGFASQDSSPAPNSQQAEKIPADKAIVYIYRPSPPSGFAGCVAADVGIPFGVKVSGKAVTTLVQGGYYAYVTEPGNIEFTAIEDKYSGPLAAKSPFSITLDAKAGQAYYLKGSHTHGLIVRLSLVLVSQEVGSKEIVSCKLITTTLGSTSSPTSTSTPAKTIPSTQAPASGSSFQLGETIPSDKAVVYIYRPSGSTGGKAMPFGVRVSDKVVTTQVQGGYYAYLTEPGNIEFTVFEIGLMAPKSTSSITVDAKAGLAYYLKGSHGKGAGGRAHLESVSPEVGANEIVNCKVITRQ